MEKIKFLLSWDNQLFCYYKIVFCSKNFYRLWLSRYKWGMFKRIWFKSRRSQFFLYFFMVPYLTLIFGRNFSIQLFLENSTFLRNMAENLKERNPYLWKTKVKKSSLYHFLDPRPYFSELFDNFRIKKWSVFLEKSLIWQWEWSFDHFSILYMRNSEEEK